MPKQAAPKGLKGKTGGVSNKWWLIGGSVGGVLFYLHMRKSSAATAATDPTATDPTATDPNAADPAASAAYGYDPYAAASGGYGGYGGGSATPFDYSALTAAVAAGFPQQPDPGTTGPEPGLPPDQVNLTGGPYTHHVPPNNNKAWMADAIHALEDKGYTKAEATAAVTAYLTGAPMTQQQIHTVESAVGIVGVPPKSPPAIEHAHPKPTGHHGSGGASHTHGGGSTHSHPGGNKPHGHTPKPKPKKKPVVSAWRGGR